MSLLNQYHIVLRYFSPRHGAMIAIAEEGVILRLGVQDNEWKVHARKKADWPYEKWLAAKQEECAELPAWAQSIRELPSPKALEEWLYDGICPTPTGDEVEPDGYGPDGAPSWLRALHLI